MNRTLYIVLFETEDNEWDVYDDNVEATSTKGAIRAALSGKNEQADGLRFVAVPRRSWNPQPVKIETRQQLKIG